MPSAAKRMNPANAINTQLKKELSPSDIVIFGGTGDLAMRKILPALYYRLQDKQLPEKSRILVLGRHQMDRAAHAEKVRQACASYIPAKDFTDKDFKHLADRMDYLNLDATHPEDFAKIATFLQNKPREVRVFYLSTPADIFSTICKNLKAAGLVTPESRVVLEKPLGYDLKSFRDINEAVLTCFKEHQIYRIDHYLGKETVQNLMVLRFANNMFERMWNSDVIDHVQIMVAENIGVEDRAGYYDHAGALRDMVQNHLLQLLCLVAMEPPHSITADAVRDEKLKILRSLRPILPHEIEQMTVRGQYRDGAIKGKAVSSYTDDIKNPKSDTETFVAIKAHVDNWRWSGVPFYICTGKRLQQRYSEIVIQLKQVPHSIFPSQDETPETNKLIIRLQPDESIKLQMITKVPGPGGYRLKPVSLNLSLAEEFDERFPDAYERLLMDVVRGNLTLFMRTDELEAAWIWTEYIMQGWKDANQKCKRYPSGSWGPEDAYALMARDGREWHRDE
ncbi:MAG: glucose-6-phosphate dehydrogenase [Rickettsiales bacterium]